MICNKCGRQIPRDAKFCAYCGNDGDIFVGRSSRYGAKRTSKTSTNIEPKLSRGFTEPSLPKEPTLPKEASRSKVLYEAQEYKAQLLAKSKEKMTNVGIKGTRSPYKKETVGTDTHASAGYGGASIRKPSGHDGAGVYAVPGQSSASPRSARGSATLGTGWQPNSAPQRSSSDSPTLGPKTTAPGQKKQTSAVGCIVWPIVLSILLGVLSQLGNISNTVSDLLFNSEAEQQSTNKYYDDAIPEVTDPVVLIDDDLVKISFDGNGGILQGSTKYPSYCVPILVENKSDRHFDVLLYEESADNLPEDAASIIWIYTNLTTGEHYVLDFQANCETLAWLETYDPPTDERIINFKGVLNIVDAEDHRTLAEYEIDIPEL